MLIAVGLTAASARAIVPWTNSINIANVKVVTNSPYLAIPDNNTDNTAAIQAAINAAAGGGTTNGLLGGTVEIPAGTNAYLCGPLTLSSHVNLQIDAGAILRMLPITRWPGGTTSAGNFISGNNLQDIELSGSGAIDGQGAPWWPYAYTNGATRPSMLSLNSCNRTLVQNLTLSNSPMFHIAIGGNAANSTVQGVTVRAPASNDPTNPSHNTDACDVSGTNVLVQNCNISNGDDDFTCGGGTHDVLLTNNVYGHGHGISIGSYTDSGGVSNITIINCTMSGTEGGLRIKSDDGRGGVVQNISYLNIGMTNVAIPIQVYSYYLQVGTPSGVTPSQAAGEAVLSVSNTTPIYRNILYSNINCTAVSGYPLGIIWARTELPATNIVFNRVNITSYNSFDCYNVSGARFIDCNLQPPAGTPTFQLFNAQVVVSNSVVGTNLVTVSGLTTNGYGNGLVLANATAALSVTNAIANAPVSLASSTLTVSNNMQLPATVPVNFTLGTNATTLAVVGNLALAGTNNIYAGPGFTNGTYPLFTYTGTLAGNLPVLGTVPLGYNFALLTNVVGQVRLSVTSTNYVPPPTPIGLTATAGNGQVVLTWLAATGATGYNLGRSTVNGGPYSIITTTAATNVTDTLVTNGTTYYYVVAAVGAGGPGTNSAQVAATPLAPIPNPGTVLADVFGTSTVGSSTPSAPTPSSVSYQVLSSKAWSPSPTVGSGHLKFGIGNTGSGCVEVQALFTTNPVVLASVGDNLSLMIGFTNTSGLLTQSGALGFGIYASGQNQPVPGGLNGTMVNTTAANATGNAQSWTGYFGLLYCTNGSSQICTRSPQTGTGANNQDLVTLGSSASFANPAAGGLGTANSAASVLLTAGAAYTELLSLTLVATNTLAITNTLYSGTGTNGTQLSQFGAIASGASYLTNSFDALAMGWRVTSSSSATAIDINQIMVADNLAANPATSSISYLKFLSPPSLSGTTLTISATNTGAGPIYLLTTTNLTQAASAWTPVWTNVLTGSGTFTTNLANVVNKSLGGQFFCLSTNN